MIASLFATALLATTAAADEIISIPFRQARTLSSSRPSAHGSAGANPGSRHSTTSKDKKYSREKGHSSSISCKASASSSGFSAAKSAHVSAGTHCTPRYAVALLAACAVPRAQAWWRCLRLLAGLHASTGVIMNMMLNGCCMQ